MLRPICVKCKVEMACVENQFLVRDPAGPGFPSTYWFGDRFQCPDCSSEIVAGFSKGICEHLLAARERKSVLEFRYE